MRRTVPSRCQSTISTCNGRCPSFMEEVEQVPGRSAVVVVCSFPGQVECLCERDPRHGFPVIDGMVFEQPKEYPPEDGIGPHSSEDVQDLTSGILDPAGAARASPSRDEAAVS